MRTMFGLAASRPEVNTAIEVNSVRKNFMMKVLVFNRSRKYTLLPGQKGLRRGEGE
jgi:hypothetical protein